MAMCCLVRPMITTGGKWHEKGELLFNKLEKQVNPSGVELVMKTMIKAIVICGLFLFFVYGALNYSGFCFREMRYLTDAEKKRIAVELVSSGKFTNGGYYSSSGSGKSDRWEKALPYESVEEFLMENPDCCTLVPKERRYGDEFDPPTLWERLSGKNNYCVFVEAQIKYLRGPLGEGWKEGVGDEINKRPLRGCFDFGNCGDECETWRD